MIDDRDRDRERKRDRASSELDLHDPSALDIYSCILILLFEDDHTHDELVFFRKLIIHLATYVSELPILYTNININPDPDNDPN